MRPTLLLALTLAAFCFSHVQSVSSPPLDSTTRRAHSVHDEQVPCLLVPCCLPLPAACLLPVSVLLCLLRLATAPTALHSL